MFNCKRLQRKEISIIKIITIGGGMKRCSITIFLIFSFILLTTAAFSQSIKRQDVVWARSTAGEKITLDGKFTESAWAKADSIVIKYGKSAGLPTSGWKAEFQGEACTDPINAVVKFLVDGNQLYLAFSIPDSSIGGTKDWARWDAILMSIKDRTSSGSPISPAEFFYGWYLGALGDTATNWVGRPPVYSGTYGETSTGRTPAKIATWEAATFVDGIANDNLPDKGWYTEMRIDLSKLGYDVTKADGDVIELNFSIWDGDNLYGSDPSVICETRACWQSPWGNVNQNNTGRVYSKPSVTINSGAVPDVAPDVIIPSGANSAAPVIDGSLDEPVWKGAYTFNIAWDDTTLRKSYPGIGPYMSGQYQADLAGNGIKPAVLDPSFATIKMFFKDNYLYFGADVNDQIVQGTETYDKADGVLLTLAHRSDYSIENIMNFKELRVSFGQDNAAHAYGFLPSLVDSGYATYAVKLKGSTTVGVNTDVDSGYVIEMKIDLTKLGYPSGLGDHLLFGGVNLLDGDSFDDAANNYGTRTWWFRENAGQQATPWMYMDPKSLITGVDKTKDVIIPNSITLKGNFPNPFNPTTKIKYSLPFAGDVVISFYNGIGQNVAKTSVKSVLAGTNEYNFNAYGLASGVYFYQIKVNGVSGRSLESNMGKMLLLK
jgi:hypothetical protein